VSPPLVVVAAAMIDADGRVLLQRRPEGKAMAGLWEFPGGKVEPGEAPDAALVRELAEELAVEVALPDVQPITFTAAPLAGRQLLLLLYRVVAWRGLPRPVESPELRWVAPAEMADLPMPPADVPLVATLGAWPGKVLHADG
jgi:8-oxo-dGTP diphosphatase